MARETQYSKIEKLDAIAEKLTEAIRALTHWKDGNGAKGAEKRIQENREDIDYLKSTVATQADLAELAKEMREWLRHLQMLWWAGIGVLVALQVLIPLAARFI
jgi:prefoldin subunit 5